jgi:hypothetical protein
MNDQDLKQYAGRLVEVGLASGETIVGRLESGEGSAYSIEQPSSNPDQPSVRVRVGSAGEIVSVRTMSAPPEMLD